MTGIVRTQPIAGIGALTLPALTGKAPARSGRILVRRAIKVTADHFGMTPDILVSARRTQPLCRRRQVAMYVARKMTGRSLEFIGHKIGDRHHTTILHGVRAIKGLLDAGNAEMRAAVEAIMGRLRVTRGRA
jgi:chromosomal replication initiator protein